MPVLSIITINYNDSNGLLRTINSVKKQDFRDFEFIVIDGGSTDESKELIEKHQDDISYWVSEPDAGIYNAMNKGILVAKGEFLLFLNSGDYLFDETSLSIGLDNLDYDIIYGKHSIESNNKIKHLNYNTEVNLSFMVASTLPHASTFVRRELFNSYGLYNEEYKICADWVFFYKAIILNKATTHHIEKPVSVFVLGGLSTNPSNIDMVNSERTSFLDQFMDRKTQDYLKEVHLKEEECHFLKIEKQQLEEELLHISKETLSLRGLGFLKRMNNLFK